jgi:dihydrofolate reductase
MRKVIVGAMVSMDGVMQAPGGPEEDPTGGFKFGGWVAPLGDDPVFGEELGKLFGEPFDLLLGRRTYDIFAAYWPYAEGGPSDDIAKTFNRITKYVATRKGVDLTWKGSVALRDATKDVAKLKQEDGPVLVT